MPSPTMVLITSISGVTLRALTPADAPIIHQLIQHNRIHLTAHGDYAAQVAAGIDDIADELTADAGRHWNFGIFIESNSLIGRVDLLGVEPPRYGLGYWLAASHVGKGIATAAVSSVVTFAFSHCGATDIFAGVTHGNEPSIALLKRLDFRPITRFDNYTRFHRAAC